MRLFIAINLSEEIKSNIETSARLVKSYSTKGSFPKRDNYHITLAFLGDVDEDRIPALRFIMDQCKVDSFPISVEEIDAFHKKDGDIVHRRIEATRRLYNVQEKLTRLLRKSDFNLDKKAFTPHITIARRVVWKKGYNAFEISDFPEMMELEGSSFMAEGMDLMLSEHISGGQKYTSLYHVGFRTVD